jgi:hypothetical protein
MDKPEYGKQYRLTGKDSIAEGKTWAEAEIKEEEKPFDKDMAKDFAINDIGLTEEEAEIAAEEFEALL